MGKLTYEINGKYYIIDDDTGAIKRIVIQDDQIIPPEDLRELIKVLAKAVAKKEAD